MLWNKRWGVSSRRATPLAAALVLAGMGVSGITSSADHEVQTSAAQPRTQDSKRGIPQSPRLEPPATSGLDAVARYTVVFKSRSVVDHLARQPSPPRISSGRPGSVGRLDMRSPEAVNYAKQLEGNQRSAVAAFSQGLGRDLRPVHTMQHALNAVTLDLSPEEADSISKHPLVALVEREKLYTLTTYAGPGFIGAGSIWSGAATGLATKGEGMIVGVIDTGINFRSPAFAGVGPVDGYVHVNPLGNAFLGSCAPGQPDAGKCTSKLIGAYNFAAPFPSTAEDNNGHGSHTASTAAGNTWNASFSGLPFVLSGVAPHASIIAYKACPDSTCPTTAVTAAINQATLDGVDAINFSIGGGFEPWNETPSLAFLNAAAAGIFVAAAAGNDGPAPSTTHHIEPWTETVAASTHDKRIAAVFDLVDGPSESRAIVLTLGSYPWANTPQSHVPIIMSPGFDRGANDGCSAFPADTFVRSTGNQDAVFGDSFEASPDSANGKAGAIAVLSLDFDSSACGSTIRRANALAAGAVGVIFVDETHLNVAAAGTTWTMLASDWANVAAALTPTSTVDISMPQVVPGQGDELANFSGRGPLEFGRNQALIKPDIAAPGADILASMAYQVESGQGSGGVTSVGMLSGTSMATPHVAGAALLLRALNPTWTPLQVKSALNLTASMVDLVDFDGNSVGPFEVGSGRTALRDAARAGLVMDETIANLMAANPQAPSNGDVSALNLAQFAKGKCIGECTFERTFRRARPGAQTYTVSVTGLPAEAYTVSPQSFLISSSGSRTLTLRVRGDRLPTAAWTDGEMLLTPANANEPVLRLPISINSYGPAIEIDPPSVAVSTVGSRTVEVQIANAGNPTLDWYVETGSISKKFLSSPPLNSGVQAGFYNAILDGYYWLQNFEVGDGGGANISLLQANGFTLPNVGGLTPANTTGVTFEIYDESASKPGQPAGAPTGEARGFGVAPRWSYTARIGQGGVHAVGGYVALDLTDRAVPALNLPTGRYWLTVFPKIEGNGGQTADNPLWAWFVSRSEPDPSVGARPVLYRPNQSPEAFLTGVDTYQLSAEIAGRLSCTLPSWLQVGPNDGSLGLGGSQALQISFDAQGLEPGEYHARVCLRSNASNTEEVEIPLKLSVPSVPFPAMTYSPSTVAAGSIVAPTLTISLSNPSSQAAALTAPLVHTFPAGLKVAPVSNAATTCASGSVTTGTNSVTLGTGAVIPAGGSCAITVDVDVPAAAGVFKASIAVGDLKTTQGTSLDGSSATLTVTAPAFCSGQPLQDPSFEATNTSNFSNAAWNATSTNDGTTLCNEWCGGAAHTGAFYAWFGGYSGNSMLETATLSQSVVIPSGSDRRLSFYHRRTAASASPTDAGLAVSIDGNVLETFPRVTASEPSYQLRSIDIPAQFEDGAAHTVEFRFVKSGPGQMGGQFVDEVTMDCAVPPPAVAVAFDLPTVDQGDTSVLKLSLAHSQNANVTLTGPLVDTLPTSLVVAPTPDASTTCPAGSLTAAPGTASVTLAAGARIPVDGCLVSVTVKANDTGIFTNTIPAGGLMTNFGNSTADAAASLRVLVAGAAQEDDFGFEASEGYSAGPLLGQKGWSAASTTLPVISSERPHTGTQHLSFASADVRPQALSPTLTPSAGRYGVVGARIRLSGTSGTKWSFVPQDYDSDTVAAYGRFDLSSQQAQIVEIDPNTGSGTPLSIGAIPIDSYFTYELILDRQEGEVEVCINGVSAYRGVGAYLSGYVTSVLIRQDNPSVAGDTYDIDNLTVLSSDIGGCGAAGVAGTGTAQAAAGVVRRAANAEFSSTASISEVKRPRQ
jgi:subtilisin family serine protease